MASTINASTAAGGGIITTADATGQLELQTAGTTRVTIISSGDVGIGMTPDGSSRLQIAGGTATEAPLELTAGTLMTTPDSGSIEYDGNLFYSAPLDSRRGISPSEYFYRLDSGFAGANATGAQSIFGVGITLAASTVYEYELMFVLIKTAGTTSHTISVGYGGTATVNNIRDHRVFVSSSSPTGVTTNPTAQTLNATASQLAAGAITTAGWNFYGVIKGTVSINAGGTFIPQYTLSAAPGGAYTTQIGSYIKIKPIGAAGATINVGGFA